MHVCVHLCSVLGRSFTRVFQAYAAKYESGKLSSWKETATHSTYSQDYQIIPLLLLLIHIRRLFKCTVNV